MVAARVEVAAGGAADHAAAAEALRQLGVEHAGAARCGPAARRCCRRARPGAETGRGSSPSSCAQGSAAAAIEIDGDAARRDAVHHQPMAESGVGGAQHQLAQRAAMGVHQGERRRRCRSRRCRRDDWRARSSSAISARSHAARGGHGDAERRLGGAGEGDLVGDRAVAADAAGELARRGRDRRPPSAARRPCGHSRAAPPAARSSRRWRGSGNGRAR